MSIKWNSYERNGCTVQAAEIKNENLDEFKRYVESKSSNLALKPGNVLCYDNVDVYEISTPTFKLEYCPADMKPELKRLWKYETTYFDKVETRDAYEAVERTLVAGGK